MQQQCGCQPSGRAPIANWSPTPPDGRSAWRHPAFRSIAAVLRDRGDRRGSTDGSCMATHWLPNLVKVCGLVEWSRMIDLCLLTDTHLKSGLAPADGHLQFHLLTDGTVHPCLAFSEAPDLSPSSKSRSRPLARRVAVVVTRGLVLPGRPRGA
jgi:hypothetical protein